MPKTYYDSELTAEQIEAALKAIADVVNPGNNGKVMYIEDGKIKAASASRWSGGAVLEPLSVTANGDYTPPTGTDGFDSVHVAVPSATLTTKSITQNGTYNASQDNADGYSSVTVAVPGSATIEPLEVTENGTYNPPSGVDGYAPVTVNVSGGGGVANPLYILNPTNMDAIAATATQAPNNYNVQAYEESILSYVNFVSKINNLSNYIGKRWVSYKGTYNGASGVAFLGRGGNDRSGMIITTKIPGGIYSKLHIRYEITSGFYSGAWFKVFLQSALGFMSSDVYPDGANTLYSQVLATALKADTEQVIDITNIVDDFYVGFGDYSGFVKIRGLWFEI